MHEQNGDTAMVIFRDREYRCPVELTISLIGGKWKAILLWELSKETIRFNEITRRFPEATRKMLCQQLREMEQDGLILRTKYAQIPPKVEYSLTDLGKSFMPVIFSMNQWGMNYVSESNTSEADEYSVRKSV